MQTNCLVSCPVEVLDVDFACQKYALEQGCHYGLGMDALVKICSRTWMLLWFGGMDALVKVCSGTWMLL